MNYVRSTVYLTSPQLDWVLRAARLQGLEDDLHMSGTQFNTLVSIFYVGYMLMQVPSAKAIAIPLCLRVSLGSISQTYKRSELAWRIAIATSGSTISYAFGALIASAVMELADKIFGFAGWRWLFLLEGSVTIIIAVFAIFIIPDYPSSPASWLTPEEHLLALRRMEEDGADSLEQDKQMSGLIEALSDWHVWWLGTALLCLHAAYSFGHFFPTLVATMGYSPTLACCSAHPRGFLMTQINVGVLISWVSNSFPHSSSKRAVGIAIVNSVAMTGNIGARISGRPPGDPRISNLTCFVFWRLSSLSSSYGGIDHPLRSQQSCRGGRAPEGTSNTYNRDGGERYQDHRRPAKPAFVAASNYSNGLYHCKFTLHLSNSFVQAKELVKHSGSGVLFSFESST
ncbi:major facilitator superfamily domain-containing protein [Melanogaster broomeanus]|nr:major facilitator superfamily domain-containing protein [Melanogaster broomeanus]